MLKVPWGYSGGQKQIYWVLNGPGDSRDTRDPDAKCLVEKGSEGYDDPSGVVRVCEESKRNCVSLSILFEHTLNSFG